MSEDFLNKYSKIFPQLRHFILKIGIFLHFLFEKFYYDDTLTQIEIFSTLFLIILQMNDKKIIRVAAAVLQNDRGEILFSSRKVGENTILWEFPGGKIEPGESVGHAAVRELREELNLDILPSDVMYITLYNYPDKCVELKFVRCFCFDYSQMQMRDNQSVRWCKAADMNADELLAADKEFLEFLQLGAIKS